MIILKYGNILDASENIICHQVNCKGVMGAGLAKQIRNRYPNVYKEYTDYCMVIPPQDLLGTCQLVSIDNNRYVANLFGQFDYGRNSCHTNYNALRKALTRVIDFANNSCCSVAIPWGIGCACSFYSL